MSSPRQYNVTDSSCHETSFGGYTNLGTHLHVSEGVINLIQSHPRAYDQYRPSNPLRTSLGMLRLPIYLKIDQRYSENIVHLGRHSTLQIGLTPHDVPKLLELK